MKKVLLSIFLSFFALSGFAQLGVSTSSTALQLANYLLGSGVTITGASMTCPTGSSGTFSNGSATSLSLNSGVILCTGNLTTVAGPSAGNASVNSGGSGIPAMAPLTGASSTFNGCQLQMTIVPHCSPLNIRYQFGSEEYPEWVSSGFNDAFGFFITGPDPGGGNYTNTNLAKVPGTGQAVSIDNINATTNNAYYINNAASTTIEYDGLTTLLTGSTAVTPCSTYTLVLAICDAGDPNYDSGVFLEQSGISCVGPTVTATSSAGGGGGGVICAGQSATLSASGASTYSWSTGATSPSIVVSPTTTTSYTLGGSNIGVCIQSNMVLTVTVNPSPTAVAGPNKALSCSQTTTVLAGSGGGTYSWSGPGIVSGGTTATPTVNAAGVYSLIVTSSSSPFCPSTVSTVTVTSNTTPPSPTASSTGTLGCTAGTATLTGTGGGTYSWSGTGIVSGGTTANPVVNGTGPYVVTVTAANGCTATANTTVAQNITPPSPTASSTGTLGCTAGTATLTGTGGGTYSWSGTGILSGATTANPVVNGTGPYVVTVTAANGCTATANTSVAQDLTPPTPSASNTATLTCSTTTAALTATGGGTYSWSGTGILSGATTANPVVNGTGPYVVTVTAANGCTATANTSVAQNITPPTPSASNTATLTCATTTAALTATGGGTYSWSGTGIVSGGTTANPVVNGTGPYVVTVTAANGCTATANTSVAQNITPPTPSASNTATLTCSTTTAALTATGGGTYSWSGTGIVSGGTTANPIVNGTGPYVVTVTAANGCTATANTSLAQNITPPTPAASSSGTLTCNTTTATLTGTGGGTYSWSGTGIVSGGTTANPIVNGTGPYVVTVTAANGCTATANTSVAQNTTAPSPTASNSGSLTCTTTTVTLTGTNGGTYSWSGPSIVSGATTANPDVDQTGVYTVTVTAANGCTATANTTVGQNTTTPVANAGPTQTLVCGVSSVTLTGSATAGSSASWLGGVCGSATNFTTTACAPGTYTLVATDLLSGCTNTSAVSVSSSTNVPQATVNAITNSITCTNTVVAIGVTYNGTDPVTYSWSGPGISGSTTSSVTSANLSGTYNVTITNTSSNCQSVYSAIVPTNTTPVAANVSTPASLTCNTTTVALSATPTGTNYAYSWSGPGTISNGTTDSPTVDANGNYIVTITDNTNGCVGSYTATVNSNTVAPTLSLTATSLTTTCSTPTVTLNASSDADPSSTYSWTPSAGGTLNNTNTSNPVAGSGGVYDVVVTNTVNGCISAPQSVTVTADANIPTFTLTSATASLNCLSASQTVTLNTSASDLTYSWSPSPSAGGNTQTPTFNTPGVYTCVITNTVNNCSTGAAQVTVTSNTAIPTMTITGGSLTCTTPSVTITGVTSPTTGISYSWTGPGIIGSTTGSSVDVNAGGNYDVTILDAANGCTNTISTSVSSNTVVPTLTLTSSSTTISCSVSTTTLAAVASTTDTPTWSTPTGASANPVIAGVAGDYIATVTDATNGCSTSQTLTVSGSTVAPTADAGISAAIPCGSPTVALNGTTTSTDVVTYDWSGPNAGSIVGPSNVQNPIVMDQGVYTLTVTNTASGCTATATINVTQGNVTAAFSANPTNGLTPLNVNFTDASTGAINYSWDFGDGSGTSNAVNPNHTFTTGTYTVILTVSSGPCIDTASVVVVVEDGLTLEIPNVFTPNGDGSNEIFFIKSTGVKEISLQIFNRWGQKLYEFTGPKASWDGLTPSGNAVPEGTYFYFVKATGFDDTKIEKHGSVNLFR